MKKLFLITPLFSAVVVQIQQLLYSGGAEEMKLKSSTTCILFDTDDLWPILFCSLLYVGRGNFPMAVKNLLKST